MALPVINSWPFKIIAGYKSEWNAATLPLQYGVTNTKWPTNTDDSTIAITSITDDNGNAKINRASNDSEVAKDWTFIGGTTNYDGAQQILSIDGNNFTIDAPFVDNDTGTTLIYYQNYTSIIRVFAGIEPAHQHQATKPIVLIGTIEQRPDTDNISLVDVRDYVKNKLTTTYDNTQASWPNDLNGWADFYISFAERYDQVVAGAVTDFTSEFRNDEADGGINYLKAAHSALQFGDARGGNMFNYLVKDVPYSDEATWMIDFERGNIIENQNWDVSIIIDAPLPLLLVIIEYDGNGVVIKTEQVQISDNGYGVYRIPIDPGLSDEVKFIEIRLDSI